MGRLSTPRLPDFIIAGAPRCGTTWLYQVLSQHSLIYLAKPPTPEPKFFLVDRLYNRGIEYYKNTWFSNIGTAQFCGEKSTNYLESQIAAERISLHCPNVKLIFMLREPVERAWSNYQWSKMNGYEVESFQDALRLEERREEHVPNSLRYARPHALFSRGLYATLLQPYFDLFPDGHIVCLKYEDIVERPLELVHRIHEFLQVPSMPAHADVGVVNASNKHDVGVPGELRKRLEDLYAPHNARLQSLLGDDFKVWEY